MSSYLVWNMLECSIIKVCSSFIDLKVGVLLDRGVSLRFVLLLAPWATFQAKNSVKSAPASSGLALKQ